jgi:hypothetical protein
VTPPITVSLSCTHNMLAILLSHTLSPCNGQFIKIVYGHLSLTPTFRRHHIITSSHHHIIMSSHHHVITSSHHHIIISSAEILAQTREVTAWTISQQCSEGFLFQGYKSSIVGRRVPTCMSQGKFLFTFKDEESTFL